MPQVPLGLLGVLFLAVGMVLSIALHEWGHFVTARRFGAKVTQFMVGFGPTLWSFRRGETEYGVKLLPLGGFVRIVGMMSPLGAGGGQVAQAAREHAREETETAQGRAFWKLSPGKRFIVMTAGPFMNLVIWAVLSLTLLLVVGVPGVSQSVRSVAPCVPVSAPALDGTQECLEDTPSPAALAGVRPGDRIVAVGAVQAESWDDVSLLLRDLPPGEPAVLGVVRDGQFVELSVVPVPSPFFPNAAYIGVGPAPELARVSPVDAAYAMGDQVRQVFVAVVSFPVRLLDTLSTSLAGEERPVDGPIGLVGMGRIGGEIVSADVLPAEFRWVQLFALLAGLNLALFVFNMVPLLPLDGGHAAAAAWEALRRRWAKWRGSPDPGPVDMARALPLTYAVAVVFIAATLMLVLVDIVNPIRLFS